MTLLISVHKTLCNHLSKLKNPFVSRGRGPDSQDGPYPEVVQNMWLNVGP